jgi:enamine deaminase RidA (YjgF/YER057c/UK114 family)
VNQEIAPDSIAPPAANYAHAIVSERAGTWLHTSGVVPIRPDRSVPESVEEQAEVVWQNLTAILRDAMMGPSDVVSITTYVVVEHLASLPWIMQIRDKALANRRVASTLVTVPALANPAWKLEIALIACR